MTDPTEEQRVAMLAFFNKNRHLLSQITAEGKISLAEAVNAVNGPRKSPDQAFKSWCDWRGRTRKKFQICMMEKQALGQSKKQFKPLQARLLDLIGEKFVGSQYVNEGGLRQQIKNDDSTGIGETDGLSNQSTSHSALITKPQQVPLKISSSEHNKLGSKIRLTNQLKSNLTGRGEKIPMKQRIFSSQEQMRDSIIKVYHQTAQNSVEQRKSLQVPPNMIETITVANRIQGSLLNSPSNILMQHNIHTGANNKIHFNNETCTSQNIAAFTADHFVTTQNQGDNPIISQQPFTSPESSTPTIHHNPPHYTDDIGIGTMTSSPQHLNEESLELIYEQQQFTTLEDEDADSEQKKKEEFARSLEQHLTDNIYQKTITPQLSQTSQKSKGTSFRKRSQETINFLEKTQVTKEQYRDEILELKKAKLELQREQLDLEMTKFEYWKETHKNILTYLANIENCVQVLATESQYRKSE